MISTRPPYRLLWSQGGFGAVNDESAAPALKGDAHPAVADLDGVPSNGLEIAVTATDGTLVAYRSDGSLYWRSTAFVLKNEAPMGDEMTVVNPSTSIADLEGDGVPEVIVGASVFNGRTGALLWRGTAGSGLNGQGPLSIVADLDDDGRLEVITGRTVYESDGRPRFTLPEAGGDGFAAVGDVLDASNASGRDGVPEVIRVANGSVSIHDRTTGAMRWTRRLDAMTTLDGAPTVADFDGDGFAEIGVAGAAEYAVFDPGCAAGMTGCARDGVRWATPTVDSSSQITSSTVFDFNGDGTAEVVYNDENRFLVLDGPTGAVVYSNWNPSQTRTEQPIVADVTGDRRADIVFGANSCMPFAGALIPAELQATERVPGLEVWSSSDDTWVGARTVWNQHGYYVDNISDDGTIPRRVTGSWGASGHNTFRLNRARGQLLDAPDVTGSAGASTCAGSTARVCVRVRNDGAAYAGVLRVGVYAGTTASGSPAAMGSTTRPLAPTQSEEVCVMAPVSAGTREAQFVVRVDQGGEARECREDNNDVAVTVTCGG